jgi:putative membrane protein
MKRYGLILAAVLGLATALYLVLYVGLDAVFGAIASLGWSGFVLLCMLYIGMFALLSVAWFILLPPNSDAGWPTIFWGRMVRDSAAEVLPLSQFGGFLIGARAVALRGVATADAYASSVVDVTTEFLAQIVFVIIGAVVFALHFGIGRVHSGLIVPLTLGPVIAALGAVGFIYLQRRGPAFAERLAGRVLPRAVGHAEAFARSIENIYATPWRAAASIAIHLVGWLVSAAISWIAVRMIGGHVGFPEMVAIESALCAIRSAAVFVPSAMGIQEASYAMLMPLFGIAPEIGLALSLLKRACNIAIGIPVLLSWQSLEGRHALAFRARTERLSEN